MAFKAENSLLHLLHRAAQVTSEQVETALGDIDVTVRQFIVLSAIEANEGVSQTVLCGATGVDRSTLADIMRRMQKRGYIARRRSKNDGRAYVVKLTDDGRKVIRDVAPVLEKIEASALATLSAKVRPDLIDGLKTLGTSASRDL